MNTKENRPTEILVEYHEFMKIFEGKNVGKLLEHGSLDLSINQKLAIIVPSKKHYHTSPEEQEILNKYFAENFPNALYDQEVP